MSDVLKLPKVYREREAVRLLRNLGYPVQIKDLRRARQDGRISYFQRGRAHRYTEEALREFIGQFTVRACPKNDTKSETTGSAGSPTVRTSKERGTTPMLDKRVRLASVHLIGKKRR